MAGSRSSTWTTTSALQRQGAARLHAMLADVAAGRIGAVVAWDLDRLHRRPGRAGALHRPGRPAPLALATVTGDADLSTTTGGLRPDQGRGGPSARSNRSPRDSELANAQRAAKGLPPVGPRALGWEADGMTVRGGPRPPCAAGFDSVLAGRLAADRGRGNGTRRGDHSQGRGVAARTGALRADQPPVRRAPGLPDGSRRPLPAPAWSGGRPRPVARHRQRGDLPRGRPSCSATPGGGPPRTPGVATSCPAWRGAGSAVRRATRAAPSTA